MALVGNISGSGGISNTIGITGSLIIANPGLATFPGFPGTDTVFFVSGAIDGKAAGSRTVAVFGGDVVASGSITVGTGSVKLTSNDIQFDGFGTRIEKSGNNLKFFDASNTGGLTLTQLNAGGGGGGSNFFTETSLGVIYNSGTVAFTGARTDLTSITAASNKGTDVVFYFSGSTAGDATTLFGGNVVTSGSYSVKTASGPVASIGNNGVISGSSNLLGGGSLTVAGDAAINGGNLTTTSTGTATLFNTNATTVNIAGAANAGTTIGNATGGVTLNGTATVTGDLAVNGGDITSSAGNFNLLNDVNNLKVGTNAATITIGGTTTATSIFGNLYVSGTVVSVDSTNLKVSDPIILIGSGSIGPSAKSAIAFSSGSTNGLANGSLIFGAPGGGDVLAAARQDVQNGNLSQASLAFTDLVPVRASQFQVGSAVSNVSSSNGTDLLLTGSLVSLRHTLEAPTSGRPVPFGVDILGGGTQGGSLRVTVSGVTPTLNINAHDGAGVQRALIASGSTVTINAATSNSTNGVAIQGAGTSLARFFGNSSNTEIDLLGTSDNLIDGTGNASAELSLSGSNINLKHGVAGGNAVKLVRGNTVYGEIQQATDGSRTYTQFNSKDNVFNVRIGTSTSGANTGNINLSGSLVEILAGQGASFQTLGTATTYLLVQSGSYVTPPATALNFAKIEAGLNNNLLVGSAGTTVVSGSGVRFNVAGPGTVAMQSHGTTFLTFASGSGTDNSVTIAPVNATTANLLNTVATTVNFAGAATILEIGAATGTTSVNNDLTVDGNTTLGNAATDTTTVAGSLAVNGTAGSSTNKITSTQTSFDLLNTTVESLNIGGAATTLAIATAPTTTQTVNLATGVTSTGNTKTINLGTGGSAGSTTNIVLGSTLGGGTITANQNLVPGTANSYDLGAVDNRWRNIYTGDLHLKNDRGNWTIVEEAEFLSITNNLSGKRYKFVLEEI